MQLNDTTPVMQISPVRKIWGKRQTDKIIQKLAESVKNKTEDHDSNV